MFGRLGGWEILIILVIILIIFGVGKLPQVGSAIGKGLRSFRKGQAGEDDDEEEEEEKEEKKPAAKKKKTTTRKKTAKS
jgi:sec-independent protein translocase protein TatA